MAATLLNLLQQTHPNDVSETTWQLGARPAAVHAPNADELEIKRRFGTNAQLFPPALATGDQQRTPYFEDLPPELQRVLRAQLHQPGDVSAVIEMPGGFVLFLATETTAESRGIATLAMPKRSYEQWLNEPGERQP